MKHYYVFLLALVISSNLFSQTSFITTWKTDNPGISRDNQIAIPTIGFGYQYTVDWGDGDVETGLTSDAIHSYKTPGVYKISITGKFPAIYFNNAGDREKILSVDQWGGINWKSMTRAFFGCSNLKVVAKDAPNLKEVKDMSGMFEEAINFNQSINHWDVSNVQNMSRLFKDTPLFNQRLDKWKVNQVTDMTGLFWGTSSFNQKISNWNVSNVNKMSYMFWNAKAFNQEIGKWNVSHVNAMGAMFEGAISFNQDLQKWNVSNVLIMTGMFMGAESFDQNLGIWKVDRAQDISNIFSFSGMSAENYESIIFNWKHLPPFQNGMSMGLLSVSISK